MNTRDVEKQIIGRIKQKITEDVDWIEKKEIVKEELEDYLISKLKSIGISIHKNSFTNMNILIDKLYRVKEDVDNITQFLVHLLSKWQNHEFYWYIEENTELFAPFLDIREGLVYGFITHKNTNPLDSFATLWYYFLFDFEKTDELHRN